MHIWSEVLWQSGGTICVQSIDSVVSFKKCTVLFPWIQPPLHLLVLVDRFLSESTD